MIQEIFEIKKEPPEITQMLGRVEGYVDYGNGLLEFQLQYSALRREMIPVLNFYLRLLRIHNGLVERRSIFYSCGILLEEKERKKKRKKKKEKRKKKRKKRK